MYSENQGEGNPTCILRTKEKGTLHVFREPRRREPYMYSENQGEENRTCILGDQRKREPYMFLWRNKDKENLHISKEN